MSDSFEQLIGEMRAMGAIQRGLELDPFATMFADRLEALLGELEPHLLPTYGQRVAAPAEDTDPPIYRELHQSSDWKLIDPVRVKTAQDKADEYNAEHATSHKDVARAEEFDDDPVTGNGSEVEK